MRIGARADFVLGENMAYDYHLIETHRFDGITCHWYLGPDDATYRTVTGVDGSHATPVDLSAATHETVFGHYMRRRWWRDHPASVDLALVGDERITWALPPGPPDGPFALAKGKDFQEIPDQESAIKADVQRRLNAMVLTRVGLLVRSPLPGFIVQHHGKAITIDQWIPDLKEGNAPLRAYFFGSRQDAAERCAEMLERIDIPRLEVTREEVEDPDQMSQTDLARLELSIAMREQPPTWSYSQPHPQADDYFSNPIKSTLAAVITRIVDLNREGKMADDGAKAAETARHMSTYDSREQRVTWLTTTAPFAGLPPAVVDLVVENG